MGKNDALTRLGLTTVALLVLAATAPLGMRAATGAAPTVSITVKAGRSSGTIPSTAFGMNTATWDSHLLDSNMPQLLKQAGIAVVRFPGGLISDAFHWKQQTLTRGSNVRLVTGNGQAKVSFDAYMGVVKKAGAQAILTVNYGTNTAGTGPGDPSEAAAWVKYANVTKHYGVKYWEIGNEVYGNGLYQVAWESDLHTDKSPAAYGNNAATYIHDMKAVDPTIKVGVVVAAPGFFPDGRTPDWNSGVLSTVCPKIDFVIVHYYPQKVGQESDSGLLSATSHIAGMVSKLRSEIKQYCGSNAKNVQILLTETNSVSFAPGKQTVSVVNALFLADDYMTWLENGAASVDWWDLHLGPSARSNNGSSLYGTTDYGDYGVLSAGSCTPRGVCETPAETPFPTYYALELMAKLGKAGDTMVSASSPQSMIAVHAVKQAKGNLAVLLINKDPSNSYKVSFSPGGYQPASKATVYSYGMKSTSITSSTSKSSHNTFTLTVAPYSLTTIVLTPQPPKKKH